jgi:hypothetical protein
VTTETNARRARPALAALLAAAALAALLALGLLAGGGAAGAGAHRAAAAGDGIPATQVALHRTMRRLWEDHVTWTRMVIVDVAAGLPSLPASQARLLRNQADIGDAIAPFYGRAAGNTLTRLLRAHIVIAGDVLTAAKAGDAARLADASARWDVNGRQIADFLAGANRAWPRAEMRRMMRDHLRLTTAEAVARLSGDWSADVRAYDRVHRQALHMADMLSDGVVAQFPARFRR